MNRTHRPAGFTLVELMVATTLLTVLLLILAGITNQTSNTLRYTNSKVEQFRSARDAFESVTRRLSQATLNTYWDYEYKGVGAARVPTQYVRQSELRFWSGATEDVTGDTPPRPTHGVFFQAPLGFVNKTEFGGLGNLLNTWGYYVEFGDESQFRPHFINRLTPRLPDRYRYRLMELMQPSNEMKLYDLTAGKPANTPPYVGTSWIKDALTVSANDDRTPVHVLAENVIALVLLPKLSEAEDQTGVRLAPGYSYDSTQTVADPEINPKNQLPPLMQVTLVAIDEISAARVANGETPPDLGVEGLFSTGGSNADNYQDDLESLTTSLSNLGLNYRVFTTHVSIRSAKWSRD